MKLIDPEIPDFALEEVSRLRTVLSFGHIASLKLMTSEEAKANDFDVLPGEAAVLITIKTKDGRVLPIPFHAKLLPRS